MNLRNTLLLLIVLTFSGISISAQSPQALNYQAVARDASGNILPNQNIAVRFSILDGSAFGATVYSETHTATTNDFGLFNLAIGGGSVASGTFSTINWGGNSKFLKVELDVNGGTSYVVMGTSQFLSVPYALYAETSGGGGGGGGTLDNAYDFGGSGAGKTITVDAGPVTLNMASSSGTGMDINMSGSSGIGLRADVSNAGVGILVDNTFSSNTYSSIQASTNATSNLTSAVIGNTTGGGWGVSGQVMNGATAEAAVYGNNLRTNGGHGVKGLGFNGVVGETVQTQGYGVYGRNNSTGTIGNNIGVLGNGWIGVYGEFNNISGNGGFAVYGAGDYGGTGAKYFFIDHPLDPENKFLKHASIESNEVLNVYRGNVELDANGEAVVTLPDYFETINKNFSYHLTPVGAAANLYVKSQVSNGQFEIAGGTPGMTVSWMVYGERNDPYMQQNEHLRDMELEKGLRHQGKYLAPELYSQPDEKGIFFDAEMEKMSKTGQPVLNISESK